ncbi:uncharacterized protein LOC143048651 [Mytilus galloprovincialis]|uniref:uncharacterized protein LOC143048651 n=1 Tax=Mytilus galloprovincialis TaxID=29158 RepID=UPI003F7C4B16
MQLKWKKSDYFYDSEGYELQIRIQIRHLYLPNFYHFNFNQVITVYAVPISHSVVLNQRQDGTSLSILNAIISHPNSVLNLYHTSTIHPGDSICENNSGNVNVSLSVTTNTAISSISAEHQLSLNTSHAHIMLRSSHLMTEVSVLDYQSSNNDLTNNGRQNRDNIIDIHAGNTSFDRSVHGNLEQREVHNHLLMPEQQSTSEEAKSKHTTNSRNVRVGKNEVSKNNKSSREQFHVLDFSRRKHSNRSTNNNIDTLDCKAQSSNQQKIPPHEAKPDVNISQVGTNTAINEQRNDFPAVASELLDSGFNRHQIDRALDRFYQNRDIVYTIISNIGTNTAINEQRNDFPAVASELLDSGFNRHQIERALDRFYQNRGHDNPTLEELRYIIVVQNSETGDETT